MQVGKPLIINLACTGVVGCRSTNPNLPINHHEIIDDVARCLMMGIQMVHLHARDQHGEHTSDPEPYGRLIESIRCLPGGRDVLITVSTSGRLDPTLLNRSRVLELDGNAKPDMASLTLGSLNFMKSVSLNAPDMIRGLAEQMQKAGIRPELEVFDVGMAHFARVLLDEGLIKPPLYVNVLLGNIASAQASAIQLAAILSALPHGCIVAIAGLGRFQLGSNGLGILLADGVRVGLEDNLWLDQGRTVHATNMSLVKRVINQAALFERPLATRGDVRRRIGMIK